MHFSHTTLEMFMTLVKNLIPCSHFLINLVPRNSIQHNSAHFSKMQQNLAQLSAAQDYSEQMNGNDINFTSSFN